jgi:hypothetical protein
VIDSDEDRIDLDRNEGGSADIDLESCGKVTCISGDENNCMLGSQYETCNRSDDGVFHYAV